MGHGIRSLFDFRNLSLGVATVTTHPKPVRVDKEILRQYEALIASLRTSDSRDPAANRFPWQCEAALKQLADLAVSRQSNAPGSDHVVVRVRTDSLPNRIYGNDVARRLEALLEKGGELRILLTAGDGEYDVESLKRFINTKRAQVRQESAPPSEDFRNHFFLVDQKAYRFEAPHGPFTGAEFRPDDDFHPVIPARICFNDERGGQSLARLFDDLWGSAREFSALAEGSQSDERSSKR